MTASDEPVLPFESAAAWEAWLEAHHGSAPGVWIKMAKKASGVPSVTHPEALDGALCFGWIDGQRRGLDETWFLQRFTPRRPRSTWSKVNREKVARLEAEGRMRPAGRAAVDAAKADGRWDAAYDAASQATVPEDLAAALAASPQAAAAFEGLDAANRFAILHRVQTAKRDATRKARIERYVAMLERGERIHP
jgi:uncharacterized protein YdeI (YjbR/CyaY-like superfamily)